MRRLTFAFLFALAATAQTQQPSPVEQWIAANAIRLTTPEARHGFEDMQALKKVVGDARIVSLGEATHGSREFFQLKHRMLEFLATEMGFTIFSIEASMPEAYRLNDYVLNGTGDPAELLAGMYFWTWNTEEVLDMIRWMREFNKSGKGRVEFTGFDMQFPNVAAEIVRGFVAKADPEYAGTVAEAAQMAKRASQTGSSGFGTALGTFPLEAARGKKLRFSGWIKTEDVDGYAGLWWRVDGKSGTLAFDNMSRQAIKGTTDWKRYEFELPVAADATNINFGALMAGAGTAWFDDLTVELDGVPYQSPQFAFDFEAPSLLGLGGGGGAGYSIRPDTSQFHGGKQSLQIRRVAPAADTVEPKAVAAAWQDVIDHLGKSREAYARQDMTPKEIAWALQNARVVWQCMQMRANAVPRDRSMADNVKWILDQNPKAKIMLWAHNGHVSKAGPYQPMGAALRQMFGAQMVVFGFAFHEGSFQAMQRGGGGLKNFTVPPAQPGTLDATLAAAGIPLFALDMRNLPKTGAVAEWFGQAHGTRSIGALYPEGEPYALTASLVAPESFDVMLFVGKTTAARKNVK